MAELTILEEDGLDEIEFQSKDGKVTIWYSTYEGVFIIRIPKNKVAVVRDFFTEALEDEIPDKR